MISFNTHTLSNGLRIIHHRDENTCMVAVNLLYNVGARDEHPDKTGFAHLFEHLMFGGSVNIPDFDAPLQMAGAENNAWTNNDFTNYYEIIPLDNVETAFWLESDRMLGLDFSQQSLDVQKNVVIEEFKQRTLNQPYGDVPKILREMAYKHHPYRWNTIGIDPSHIENATLEDVKSFFYKFYAPNNAVLSIVGNITFDEAVRLSEKWFSPIPRRAIGPKNIPSEPTQTEARFVEVHRDVPSQAIYKVYHMCAKAEPEYVVCDLISDLLSNGLSSRLYQSLVQEQKLFTQIDAYVGGDEDPGLFYIKGKPIKDLSLEKADIAIQQQIDTLLYQPISDYELEKVKNKYEANQVFAETSYTNKASKLAYYELVGRREELNSEVEKYRAVTVTDIKRVAEKLFHPDNGSTLFYRTLH